MGPAAVKVLVLLRWLWLHPPLALLIMYELPEHTAMPVVRDLDFLSHAAEL